MFSHGHHEHRHGGDGHGRDHEHDGHHLARRLGIALALTAAFLVVEVVGGWLSGSLALLADAGHMATDAVALGLAVIAQRIAERPRSRLYTFGFRRAEMLAALVNGLALVASGFAIVIEAVRRWGSPSPIAGGAMLTVAIGGLVVNLASAWVLSVGHGHNANVRAAFLHVLADAAGSVAAIVAAALVLALGWRRADLVVSVLVAALVVAGAARLVRSSSRVLMEASPVDAREIEATVRAVAGVADLHDLHVWTLADGFVLLSVHVVLDGHAHGTDVARAVGDAIRERHGIAHVTVQPEPPSVGLVPAARLVRHA